MAVGVSVGVVLDFDGSYDGIGESGNMIDEDFVEGAGEDDGCLVAEGAKDMFISLSSMLSSLSYVELSVGAGDTDGACDDVGLSDGTKTSSSYVELSVGAGDTDGTVVVEGTTDEYDGTFDGKGVGRKGTKS